MTMKLTFFLLVSFTGALDWQQTLVSENCVSVLVSYYKHQSSLPIFHCSGDLLTSS